MGAVRAAQMEEIDHENKQVSNFLVSDVTIFPPYLPMLLFFPLSSVQKPLHPHASPKERRCDCEVWMDHLLCNRFRSETDRRILQIMQPSGGKALAKA